MRAPETRGPQGGDEAGILLLIGSVLVFAAAALGWAALALAAAVQGRARPPMEPEAFVRAARAGQVRWDAGATAFAVGLGGLLLTLVAAAVVAWARSRTARAQVDRAAAHLAKPRDLRPLRAHARRAQAKRLGLPPGLAETHPGLPLGDALLPPVGRRTAPVFASWEDTAVLIAGPRTNKTTAYAIPMLLAAPGAALATSNKRDVLDATRALRTETGDVWVFDPQHVAAEPPRWWWDPTAFVLGRDGRPEPARAARLAAQLVASTTPADARADAYFDTEKTNLLALLLLAAAVGGHPTAAIWRWLCDPADEEPGAVLTGAGHDVHARALDALASLPDRQREGVYGSARAVVGFLLDPDVTEWITPTVERPAFDPSAFARSGDTLYLLSREGSGGAAPLVAALTMAVTDALEQAATASPGGRLAVPFVGVLDEAANICRLRDLDSLYSHYGSRGICLVTILQSWAQGAGAWGPVGMEKLWSAANVAVYGGGVDDATFLDRLSRLVGVHERVAHQRSTGHGRDTRTRSLVERTTLPIAELRRLPAGRALVFASGTAPFLLAARPWWTGPHAAAIEAALTAAAARTGTALPGPRVAAEIDAPRAGTP